MARKSSRRQFLATATSAAMGASAIGKRSVAAKDQPRLGANDTLRFGLIGCGSRGPYLAYVAQITPNVKVDSLCDVHQGRMAKAIAQTEKVGQHKVNSYGDYRRLLDDKGIDAVIVATTAHWHVLPAIDACAAGKDVYLEKPLGHTIVEGRAAVNAARKHDRIVQMGTQQRTWEHYQRAVEIIRSGRLGEISQVHVWDIGNLYPGMGSPPNEPAPTELDWDFWLGPAPKRPYNRNRERNHSWFFDYGGGWQVAWGTHHYDVVHWAMGTDTPISAMASGRKFAFPKDNTERPDTFNGACQYPSCRAASHGFLLSYTARSGCSQPIEGRRHGKAFYGTDGVLVIDRSGFEVRSESRDNRKVIAEESMASTKSEHDVVIDHMRTFVDCVRARRRPAADVEVGHHSTTPGHLMNIAWWLGRRVKWDRKSEQVIDDPKANALLSRRYRAPWSLPQSG